MERFQKMYGLNKWEKYNLFKLNSCFYILTLELRAVCTNYLVWTSILSTKYLLDQNKEFATLLTEMITDKE